LTPSGKMAMGYMMHVLSYLSAQCKCCKKFHFQLLTLRICKWDGPQFADVPMKRFVISWLRKRRHLLWANLRKLLLQRAVTTVVHFSETVVYLQLVVYETPQCTTVLGLL